jgi:signal transduction histidine kinase
MHSKHYTTSIFRIGKRSNALISNTLRVLVICLWLPLLGIGQKPDSNFKPANANPFLMPEDSSTFRDKYIISELEKVQYAKYSEDLKKAALQKLLENQTLQNTALQQKLKTEQLEAEAARKESEAKRKEEAQKQKIKQLEIAQLNQRLTLQQRTRNFLYLVVGLLATLGLSLLWLNLQLFKRNKAVQRLSDENLEKEQEKQQILATQNETLELQVNERTAALKASQAQLIQSEKLASLGELTAGIAHEIQNPLNFVNNFAEVSAELLDEMQEELDKGDTAEAIAIANDLKSNLGKIALHGKRASSIVKGMLEHSRSSTGVKELTDLNQMADEYLRLAYHGLRAKDSSFSVQFETDLDPQMPKVAVVPQDLSRVLLNLINNAFYATNERAKSDAELKPMVKVSTRKLSDKQVEIRVQDNGNGIPEHIREKIFQPFFTTKPTGQGTGLGLSLAYDIVTKGHGGTLDVESQDQVGTIFTIRLNF